MYNEGKNMYLVEAFVWDKKGGSVKSYLIFADNSQQAADKCRKYGEVNSIISVNLKMEDWK